MEISTINAKGQVTIPAKMRKRLSLEPGSQIRLYVEPGDQSMVIKPTGSIQDGYGLLEKPSKAATVEEMNAAVTVAASRRALRHDRD
ncbi:MAG: AbrB/MazE/SpoVT family DNA-binding domain-containing protein [Coraliomargarita sp. TMED73]|nr:MAG: AbrB/MazE/SpoVT family DNA-binding domain-containing protein [Coraliomargarita sp. TMED73]|tara:strand:+ start:6775 stop:7035 length:261 start_codon:yes stop_codon:yes gene_type:complete